MGTVSRHTPVLVEEVLALFQPKKDDILLDATIGHGGHARAFLDAAGRGSTVVGIDADDAALGAAKKYLEEYAGRVTFIQRNFAKLDEAARDSAHDTFTHILFDLGVGSHQLADIDRGFSFQSTGPLRMKYGKVAYLPLSRIDVLNVLERKLGGYPDAVDIITHVREDELAHIIRMYGEERYALNIARAIKSSGPLPAHARELSSVIARAIPASRRTSKIHPATRTFQALRIAVNRELESLERALPQAVGLVAEGGKIAVISFHSLEDRIVKRFFQREAKDCVCPPQQVPCVCRHKATLKILTKRPVTASKEELFRNPRARSAKLRVAERKRN